MNQSRTMGTLYAVGVGPGDPDLLTLQAVKILSHASVIAYTVDEQGASIAREVAAAYIPKTARHLPLRFSMSPMQNVRVAARRRAALQVLEILTAGKDVVFITEGDPLIYSTFQHLMAELPKNVRTVISPGVSSLTAAAAVAQFPLVIEGQRMVIGTADQTDAVHFATWLTEFDTVVLFKVHRHLPRLVQVLKEYHALDQALLVTRATMKNQVIVRDLIAARERALPYFSILLVRGNRAKIAEERE